MSRLLAIWLTLLAAFWLTRAAASAVLFGTADRSYEGTVQLVIVPAIQAVIVALLTRRPGTFALAVPVRAALRQADVRAILLLDCTVLALGWFLGTLGGLDWFSLAGATEPAQHLAGAQGRRGGPGPRHRSAHGNGRRPRETVALRVRGRPPRARVERAP